MLVGGELGNNVSGRNVDGDVVHRRIEIATGFNEYGINFDDVGWKR